MAIEVGSPTTVEEALAMAEEAEALRIRSDALTSAVASALPSLRVTSSISQSFLATSSGVSQPYLSQIENHERTSPETVLAVTRTLYDYSRRAGDDLAAARRERR